MQSDNKIEMLLEAERRGILPPEKKAMLDEARRRGLIGGKAKSGAAPTLKERSKEVFGFEDYPKRGTVLPLAETKEGKTKIAWPQIAVDVATSFLLPGHVVKGGSYTPEDATGFAMNFASPNTMRRNPASGANAGQTRGQFARGAPTTEELMQKGSAGFQKAEASGVEINPDKFVNFLADIEATAAAEGVNPTLHPKVTAVIGAFNDRLGQNITVKDIEIMRRQIGVALKSIAPEQADERRIAELMQDQLDDMIDNLKPGDVLTGGAQAAELGPTLEAARKAWFHARKSERIEDAVENAKLAASGFENGLRIEFRRILKSKRLSRGFDRNELAFMKMIERGGLTETTLRLMAKTGFSKSGSSNLIGLILGAAAGHTAFGPVGAVAVPLIGQGAKVAAEAMGKRRAAVLRAMAATGKKAPPNIKNQFLLEMLRQGGRSGAGALAGNTLGLGSSFQPETR